MHGTEKQISWAKSIINRLYPDDARNNLAQELVNVASAWIDMRNCAADKICEGMQAAHEMMADQSDPDDVKAVVRRAYVAWYIASDHYTFLHDDKPAPTAIECAKHSARFITEKMALSDVGPARLNDQIARRMSA